jgi:hypothetical protein
MVMNIPFRNNKLAWFSLATGANLLFSGHALASQNLTVSCGSTGQACANAAAFSVNTPGQRPVRVRLQTPATHCSDVRYTVTGSSGAPILTGFLPPNASQLINLGPLVSGQHWFLISATGRSGGCNAGTLGSWGVVVTP